MISVNMSISDLADYVLEFTKHINCGSSLTSLIPTVLFLWNLRGLAHTFLKSLNGRRHGNINQLGQYFLKNVISSILIWSGVLCWSHGLIRFLNTYTAVFLTMINGCLKTNYQMSQTVMDLLERVLKWIVCYAVSVFVRLCDIYLQNSYSTTYYLRIRRIRRLRLNNGYRIVIPRERQINELGEQGVMLSVNNWFPELPEPTENSKPIKLLNTQSCHLLTNITSISSKQTKKRSRSI